MLLLQLQLPVPTHNCHGSIIQLPQPTHTGGRCPAAPVKSIPQEWAMLYENLLYYTTLSCNPETIISCLCGAFWEPGTPCNLVSPWLHPILNEVPEGRSISDSPGLYAEILAIICGVERPSISALWLGAVAGGLTPIILRRVRRADLLLTQLHFRGPAVRKVLWMLLVQCHICQKTQSRDLES